MSVQMDCNSVEIIIMSSLSVIGATLRACCGFTCFHNVGNSIWGNRWKDIEHVSVSCMCTFLNVLCFCLEFKRDELLAQKPPSLLMMSQTSIMLGYYIVYGAIELMRPPYDLMAVHHILAAITIYAAHTVNTHQCICVFLFLFTISNPPLAVAKAQYRMSNGEKGYVAFGMFASLFFICRICLVPCVILTTLIDGWTLSTLTGQYNAYYSIIAMLIGLYAIQLAWFPKILRTCIRLKEA